MDLIKEKLKEKSLVFLYVLSKDKDKINYNTFRRYIYLYYLSGKFVDNETDEIVINIDKGDMNIAYLDEIINDFELDDYVEIKENEIVVLNSLKEKVETLLKMEHQKRGIFYQVYKSIRPFVTLLNSYDEQFIFTIFFSEPTFQEASERGVKEVNSSSSRLSELLKEFKDKVTDEQIDNYDILTYWMDFVLKNYYR